MKERVHESLAASEDEEDEDPFVAGDDSENYLPKDAAK